MPFLPMSFPANKKEKQINMVQCKKKSICHEDSDFSSCRYYNMSKLKDIAHDIQNVFLRYPITKYVNRFFLCEGLEF